MPQAFPGIAALVLAAGEGTRLGGGKLLLRWRGKPLIRHVLEQVFLVPEFLSLTVVLGHQASALERVLEDFPPRRMPFPLRVACNPLWREGQSTSLQCGISALLEGPEAEKVQGVCVFLGDQPLIRAETADRLCAAHRAALARNPAHAASVPIYGQQRGNPVVLSRSLFPRLSVLRGDTGARGLLASLGQEVLQVPVCDPGILQDVDSPEDYAALP
ncbi:MAG: nucleotidyltransferase family protein [Desulfovibrio sp.]|jgi:molybdenum cofactor cytidylyltransferase|nr:nucleotidyltransferase family protein [Desulfovibrio sp.]